MRQTTGSSGTSAANAVNRSAAVCQSASATACIASSNRSFHGASSGAGRRSADRRAATAERRPPGSAPPATRPADRLCSTSSHCSCSSARAGSGKPSRSRAAGRHAHGLIGAARQVSRRRRASPAATKSSAARASCLGGQHGQFGQGDLVVRMLCQKGRGRGSGGLVLVGRPQQQALGGQQTGPIAARLLLQQVVDVLQAGQVLLAFDHAVDLLQFGEEIAAAELDLLARAAGTKRIGVEAMRVVGG